ncbi:MAG: protealysin inhibitor emfourin [Chloroflexota bacterium]|nr:protealysin inhibitor emfourin [Chloroflexota bacterium]
MKRRLPLLILFTLCALLAACGTPPAPTATRPSPTQTPPPSNTPEATATIPPNVLQARTSDAPAPGTLVVRGIGNTQTAPAPFTFDTVVFIMSGGITGATLNITLDGEGNVTRNAITSVATPEQVEAIRAALEAINFFGLQGQFAGITASDTYSYEITVEGSQGSRGFRATEGLIPPELQAIFDLLVPLGL